MSLIKHNEQDESLRENSKILIVEDDRIERMMLRQIFENEGFKHIYETKNGAEGWEITLEVNPDLILLDVNMPMMDGFAFLKKARSTKDYINTPILVQTGSTDTNEKARIFKSGATDYVSKPLDFHEIIARSFVHLRNALNVKNLTDYNMRVKNQLASAKNLIEMSLPDKNFLKTLAKKYNIEIASKFQSSQEMGGDFWGCRPVSSTRLAVYNIDVSGHGIDSSLSALRIHTLLHANSDQLHDPGEILELLNKKLSGLFPPGQFCTMFYGIIDIKQDLLKYATAATPNPIVMHLYKSDMTTKSIEGSGFPLGAFGEATFQTKSMKFEQGDSLVLYSDAITEAMDKHGVMFGEKRLEELLKKAAKQKDFSAKEAMQEVLSTFYKECGTKLNDDLTFNIYHRLKAS